MEPPTLAQLREIAERAEVGRDGLFFSVVTPAVILQLLDLIEAPQVGGTP